MVKTAAWEEGHQFYENKPRNIPIQTMTLFYKAEREKVTLCAVACWSVCGYPEVSVGTPMCLRVFWSVCGYPEVSVGTLKCLSVCGYPEVSECLWVPWSVCGYPEVSVGTLECLWVPWSVCGYPEVSVSVGTLKYLWLPWSVCGNPSVGTLKCLWVLKSDGLHNDQPQFLHFLNLMPCFSFSGYKVTFVRKLLAVSTPLSVW